MLSSRARPALATVVDPLARGLLRVGLTPDAVTVLGTTVVVVAALVGYPQGYLFATTLVVVVFVLADSLDGTMARLSGGASPWGAFLDSTLDRVADAAIFAGLAAWFVATGDRLGAALTLAALVLGQLVSYVRARAEGLGASASVGFAERAERVIVALLAAGLVGLGLPAQLLVAAMGVLVVASLVTIGQRVAVVRRQLRPRAAAPGQGR